MFSQHSKPQQIYTINLNLGIPTNWTRQGLFCLKDPNPKWLKLLDCILARFKITFQSFHGWFCFFPVNSPQSKHPNWQVEVLTSKLKEKTFDSTYFKSLYQFHWSAEAQYISAQNLFKIRKRFTRETVVQGRSANTDPQTQHIQRLEFGVKYVQSRLFLSFPGTHQCRICWESSEERNVSLDRLDEAQYRVCWWAPYLSQILTQCCKSLKNYTCRRRQSWIHTNPERAYFGLKDFGKTCCKYFNDQLPTCFLQSSPKP